MALFPRSIRSLAAFSVLAAAPSAFGQQTAPQAAMQGSIASRPVAPSPMPLPAVPGQFARPSVASVPGRTHPPAPAAKPFQMTPARPTISPYLQLHREDLDDTLPNYFAFVLPQMQQQELLQRQQAELSRIHQRLLQTARPGTVPDGESPESTSGPSPNYHARFLNTGGYFSGVAAPASMGASGP